MLIAKDGDTKGGVNKEIVDELKIISSRNTYHLHLSPFIVLHRVQNPLHFFLELTKTNESHRLTMVSAHYCLQRRVAESKEQ
jgi:hypothetical protein